MIQLENALHSFAGFIQSKWFICGSVYIEDNSIKLEYGEPVASARFIFTIDDHMSFLDIVFSVDEDNKNLGIVSFYPGEADLVSNIACDFLDLIKIDQNILDRIRDEILDYSRMKSKEDKDE